MKRGFVLVFILFFLPFALAYGGVGESCTGDEECSGALLCENAVCSSPKKGTVEVVAQTVAVNETQKNLEEEMNSGGITSDNPFLGWADTLVDTVQSKTSNDPSVQKKIVQEALDESQFLDQRKERGQISETSYLKAKTKSGEKSVQGIQNGYQTLSQQSSQSGEVQRSLQEFESLASKTENDLRSLRSPPGGNGEFARNIQQLRSDLVQAPDEFIPQYSGPAETYTCTNILEESVVGDFLVRPSSDGSLLFVDSSGSSYLISGNAQGFSVSGDSVSAYANRGSSSGSEVIFTLGSSEQSPVVSRGQEGEGSPRGERGVSAPTGRAIQNLISLFGFNVFAGTGRAVEAMSPREDGPLQNIAPQNIAPEDGFLSENTFQEESVSQIRPPQDEGQRQQGQGQNQSLQNRGQEISQERNTGQQGDIASEGKRQEGVRSQPKSGSSFYSVSVDSQNIGSIDLNTYGQSIFALGNTIIYSYEVDTNGVRFLMGDSLAIYVSSTVGACQLELEVPQELLIAEQSLDEEGFFGEFPSEEEFGQEGFENNPENFLNQPGQVPEGEIIGLEGEILGENIQQMPGVKQNIQAGEGVASQGFVQNFTGERSQGNIISQERNQGQQGEIASAGRRQGVSGARPADERSQGNIISQERNQGQQGEIASAGRRQGVSGIRSADESSLGRRMGEDVGSERQRTRSSPNTEINRLQTQGVNIGTGLNRQQEGLQQNKIQPGPIGSPPPGSIEQNGPPGPPPTGQVTKELFEGSSQNIIRFLFFRE